MGAILLLNNCKNDLEVVDEWKENMVVYGLLNQADTIQYVKINKVYLGEGDALQMAQVYDSIYYDTTKIEVKLLKLKNGNVSSTYYLQPDLSIPKDPGIFSYPNQLIYKLKTTGTAKLDSSCEYHLEVKNKVSGYTASGKTKLLSQLPIAAPAGVPTVDYSYTSSTPAGVKAAWESIPNGRLYSLTIRFYYTEYQLNNVTLQKYVDWNFGNQRSLNIKDGGDDMSVTALNSEFYTNIASKITDNTNVVKREANIGYNLEYIFSVAADDFSTYMEANAPSSGIVQDKPTYTNIENGIGIFSSRYTRIIRKSLSAKSIDELNNGSHTAHLKFQ